MKGLLLMLTMVLTQAAYAQSQGGGYITIGEGRTTIGIRIGSDNSNHTELIQRTLRLEQAVRDLQIQVYNLSQQDIPANESLFECELFAFSTRYAAEADTQAMASSQARNACLAENHEMHCRRNNIVCTQLR